MKQPIEQELQISEFIKDPASLKLLILAGTKIRANQIATVNKCTSLIKLDLSSNQLLQLPLKLSNFTHMRILYLHDNSLSLCTIHHTNLEYLSLFDNPIKNYRAQLVQYNPKLLAIDFNVVTKWERTHLKTPKSYTQLKWPIVQISQALQHQQDYLNLLKAELFVITQVYKKAQYMDSIKSYVETFIQSLRFQKIRKTLTKQAFFKAAVVKNAVTHWMDYTEKKKKLRRILAGTPAQSLLMNQLQRIKMKQSPKVRRVVSRFVESLRQMMRARKVLQRGFRIYRMNIPTSQNLTQKLRSQELKLYFFDSQFYYLEKILLYAKKFYFNKKQYDICDNFEKIVSKSKKTYYVFRKRFSQAQTMLLGMVKFCMGLIICQKNIDKRSMIYNRRGHKRIQIKKSKKNKQEVDENRRLKANQRIDRLYNRYDTLIQYKFSNQNVFETVLKLIKYFNSGNAQMILQTKAAYFQTEVEFQQKQKIKQKQTLAFTSSFLFKRAHAANIIQKAWRRYRSNKIIDRNIFQQIKVIRAKKLIGKWLRDMTFRHRLQLSKYHSFLKSSMKESQLYLQVDIYMNLPNPNNLLKIKMKEDLFQNGKNLYNLLHTKTEVQIVQLSNRSWLKIKFLSSQQAFQVQKILSISTFRYYFNGTFIKFFTSNQIYHTKDLLLYQQRIQKLFQTKVNIQNSSNKLVKKLQIENPQPFFIWPYVQEGFASMFKAEQIQSLPISIFIYNKNRRPLKINCDLLWISPPSIYFYKKKVKIQLRVRTPKKETLSIQQTMDISKMAHIRHKQHRQRQFSMQQHKSLLQANRQRGKSQLVHLSLLSETLNIKRHD